MSYRNIPTPSMFKLFMMPKAKYYDFQIQLMHDYPDIVHIPGFRSCYNIFRAEYVQHILQHNAKNYNKDEYTYDAIRIGLGNSLLTENDYHDWRELRRHLQPLFYTQNLSLHANNIVNKTQKYIQKWLSLGSQNKSFDLYQEMKSLTADLIQGFLVGKDLEPHLVSTLEFGAATNYFMGTGLVKLRWLPSNANRQFKHTFRKIKMTLQSIINRRRQNPTQDIDLLNLLLTAIPTRTDDNIVEQLITFLITGYESTATAISFGCYEICQAALVQEQLQAELAQTLNNNPITINDIDKLPYTQQVVDEMLRLYPSIWLFGRKPIEDDQLGDYHIKAGSQIFISPYVIHRNPEYWPEPLAFNPDNFSPSNVKSRPKGSYFPFGRGARACIGKPLALLQSQIIIASIFQQVRLEFLNKKPMTTKPLTTLVPDGEMLVKAFPR